MAKSPCRKHLFAFETKVVQAAVKRDKNLVELCEYFDVHASHITRRKTQLLKWVDGAFDDSGARESPIAVAMLHAKIGNLALESDF